MANPLLCAVLALGLALPFGASARASDNPDEAAAPGNGEGAGGQGPDPQGLADGPFVLVPFEALSVTRERPLFAPTRRPPPQPDAEPPPPPEPPAVSPARPVSVDLRLSGTVVGAGGGYAILVDPATGNAVRLRVGEVHGGWVLQSVDERSARLRNGDESTVLTLPKPESGGASPSAGPARAP